MRLWSLFTSHYYKTIKENAAETVRASESESENNAKLWFNNATASSTLIKSIAAEKNLNENKSSDNK